MEVVGIIEKNISKEKLVAISKYIFLKEKISIVDNEFIDDKRTLLTLLNGVKKDLSIKKINELIKISGLTEQDLKKKSNELSTTEIAKAKFAIAILEKPDVIILKDIDKYLIDRDKKKLIKTIELMIKKTDICFVIVSKDIMFLKNICKFYYYMDSDRIFSTDKFKELFFDEDIIPDTFSFIDLARIYGHDLSKYDDVKEIIKAIYRGE